MFDTGVSVGHIRAAIATIETLVEEETGMFPTQHVRQRRPWAVHTRTSDPVKSHLNALVARHGCSESEVVHSILSHHFGCDPHTGLELPPGPDAESGSGQRGPAGLAS
jgi:hypothetical protein